MNELGLNWNLLFSTAAALLLILAAVYASRIRQGGLRWWLPMVLMAAAVLVALQLETTLARMFLLDAAALAAVAWVWLQDQKAGRKYLAAVVIGAGLVALGIYWLGGFSGAFTQAQGWQAKAAAAAILVGFALKLAWAPFYFWLMPVAENTSPLTAALIIGVLDMAEFGELALLRAETPWLFTDYLPVWVGLALFSMFVGALLALAQTNLRRMLAFSTVDDMGYLLLGVAVGSAAGLEGALIGALSHALCKFLLFAAVGTAEHSLGKQISTQDRGLAAQFPVSAAAFIAGALGMIGVPPFLGFAGRWRLYFSGVELGGFWLGAAMAVATALALFYYVRAIHRVWLGKAEVEVAPASEPDLVKGVLIVLVAVLLLAGLFPGILLGLGA